MTSEEKNFKPYEIREKKDSRNRFSTKKKTRGKKNARSRFFSNKTIRGNQISRKIRGQNEVIFDRG